MAFLSSSLREVMTLAGESHNIFSLKPSLFMPSGAVDLMRSAVTKGAVHKAVVRYKGVSLCEYPRRMPTAEHISGKIIQRVGFARLWRAKKRASTAQADYTEPWRSFRRRVERFSYLLGRAKRYSARAVPKHPSHRRFVFFCKRRIPHQAETPLNKST